MKRLGVARLAFVPLVAAGLVLGGAASASASNVDPASVTQSLDPGATFGPILKTVTTLPIPPTPDIYFLSDTTGSMGPAIANVQANASSIMSTVAGSTTNPMFGAGDYKDFLSGDPYAFQNGASIGSSAAAQTAINNWSAVGGDDGPEAQLFALHELATDPSIGFRTGSTRIVVWFGDAPGHDPICTAVDPSVTTTLTTNIVSAELHAAHIEVIAVSVSDGSGYPNALNDDVNSSTPPNFNNNYGGLCGPAVSITGEATAIAAATNGEDLFAPSASDVSNVILSGLQSLPVEVEGVPTCDAGLTVSLTNNPQTVQSGDDATFDETITVDPGATQGATLTCTVKFLLNGQDSGADFTESISIAVNDITAPTAACVQTTNPSGKNVPKAGPGAGKSGQNPDGFYQMLFSDNVGVASAVIQDSGSTFSVAVSNGEKDKLVQAPGATPNSKPGPGDITKHITTNGDPFLVVTDTSGNVTTVACLVPPPPK